MDVDLALLQKASVLPRQGLLLLSLLHSVIGESVSRYRGMDSLGNLVRGLVRSAFVPRNSDSLAKISLVFVLYGGYS